MNFESHESSAEKETAEYVEKLRAALEDAEQFGDQRNVDDQEYKDLLERELKRAESPWE